MNGTLRPDALGSGNLYLQAWRNRCDGCGDNNIRRHGLEMAQEFVHDGGSLNPSKSANGP